MSEIAILLLLPGFEPLQSVLMVEGGAVLPMRPQAVEPEPAWGLLFARSSATAEALLFKAALLQREALNALLCTPNDGASAESPPFEDQGSWERGDILWAVRMSVGLLDVPPGTLSDLESVSCSLREGLPWPSSLEAEASLVSAWWKAGPSGAPPEIQGGPPREGNGAMRALGRVLRCYQEAPPRRNLLASVSPRLISVLRQLLQLLPSKSLYRRLVTRPSPPRHASSLTPAGELLLAAMKLCLQQQKALRAPGRPGGLQRREWEAERQEKNESDPPTERTYLPPMPLQLEQAPETYPASPEAACRLQRYASRLRAECAGLEALQRISATSPLSALLALEQMLQQPQLQHLEALKTPSESILSGFFYECLLRWFAPLAAPHEEGLSEPLSLQLHAIYQDLMRRSGLRRLCLRDVLGNAAREEATRHFTQRTCAREGREMLPRQNHRCQRQEETVHRFEKEEQVKPQVDGPEEAPPEFPTENRGFSPHEDEFRLLDKEEPLLLPPDNYEATAKAFCCFLNQELRPYSPWLPRHSADCTKRGTPEATADGGCSVGTAEFSKSDSWEAHEAAGLQRPLPKGLCGGNKGFWISGVQRLAPQLRALDEELRPSAKGDRQKRRLLRVLARSLKAPRWLEAMEEKQTPPGGTRTCQQRVGPFHENKVLPPLLLPYGSSVTGFGHWNSDLDIALLLPYGHACGYAEHSNFQAPEALPRSLPTPDDFSGVAEGPCISPYAENTQPSLHSLAYCCKSSEEPQDSKESPPVRLCLQKSLPRGAAASVLTQLQCLLKTEPQIAVLLADLEVVIPQKAPPVLRGVYLHPRIHRARPHCRPRRSKINVKETAGTAVESSGRRKQEADQNRLPQGRARSGDTRGKGLDTCTLEGLNLESATAKVAGTLTPTERTQQGKADKSLLQRPTADGLQSTEDKDNPFEVSCTIQSPKKAVEKLSPGEMVPPKGLSISEKTNQGPSVPGCIPVKFEITAGCILGPLNSAMLKVYGRSCPLLPPLARLIRHWAECRGLTGTRNGYLSSYAWSLLVTFFCLSTSPPLLPHLQRPLGRVPPVVLQQQLHSGSSRATPRSEISLQPTEIPVEFVEGLHSVWFLNPEASSPWGSRALDLLRPIYKGAQDSRLLQLLNRYIPGHVFVLPSDFTENTGETEVQESRISSADAAAHEACESLPADVAPPQHTLPSSEHAAVPTAKRAAGSIRPVCPAACGAPRNSREAPHSAAEFGGPPKKGTSATFSRSRNRWESPLRDRDWEVVASLFYSFFVFYGYHFNSCALLVSLQRPHPRYKQHLRVRRGRVARCGDNMKALTTPNPISGASVVFCPCTATEKTAGAMQHERSRGVWRHKAYAPGMKRAAGKGEGIAVINSTVAASSAAVGAGRPGGSLEREQWGTAIVGGQPLGVPSELILRGLKGQCADTPQVPPLGVTLEDPMDAGRLHKFRKPPDAPLVLRSPLQIVERAPCVMLYLTTTLKGGADALAWNGDVTFMAPRCDFAGSEHFYFEVQRAERLLREGALGAFGEVYKACSHGLQGKTGTEAVGDNRAANKDVSFLQAHFTRGYFCRRLTEDRINGSNESACSSGKSHNTEAVGSQSKQPKSASRKQPNIKTMCINDS
ncbi:hypothetical protein cyc_01392 [Cyclospora cayetanensis]|uniref:Polynucleotide adenylyltransferase n=1 Tax=Cyclospora cayetanensis TaxID=88456 RepID=A0A1D3CXX7_9EIME|nr:hypothetical protein cyc_01392 [Cyclospora cayetanensis]